ncbi:MAG: hypothetical protein KF713_00390 [Turneriella sp.]|nr:hypothetical protein [Turneriella sp.]
MLPFIAIERFGLVLQQIRDADSEIVHAGRNQPFVRRNHFYTEIITPDQHRAWYKGICHTRDYYLVASQNKIPMGMLYLKDITPGMHTGHIGVFFWKEDILGTRKPILAIIAFLDFFLFSVGMQNIEAIIRMDNKSMDNIVQFLKFDLCYHPQENILKANYTRERLLQERPRLMDFAQRLSREPATWRLQIRGEKDSRHHPEILRVIP